MTEGQRLIPDPEITPETSRFWAEANEGRLSVGRCESCGEAYYYPRALCPFCLSGDTRLETSSGKGVIYSYSVPRAAVPPYVIALVTLAEGPTIMTNIVDCCPDTLRIGQPVRLTFRTSEGGQSVPVFTPQATI